MIEKPDQTLVGESLLRTEGHTVRTVEQHSADKFILAKQVRWQAEQIACRDKAIERANNRTLRLMAELSGLIGYASSCRTGLVGFKSWREGLDKEIASAKQTRDQVNDDRLAESQPEPTETI